MEDNSAVYKRQDVSLEPSIPAHRIRKITSRHKYQSQTRRAAAHNSQSALGGERVETMESVSKNTLQDSPIIKVNDLEQTQSYLKE